MSSDTFLPKVVKESRRWVGEFLMSIICSPIRSRIICKEKNRSFFEQPNIEQISNLHYDKSLVTQEAWEKNVLPVHFLSLVNYSSFPIPLAAVKTMKYKHIFLSWGSKFLKAETLTCLSLSSRSRVQTKALSGLIWLVPCFQIKFYCHKPCLSIYICLHYNGRSEYCGRDHVACKS